MNIQDLIHDTIREALRSVARFDACQRRVSIDPDREARARALADETPFTPREADAIIRHADQHGLDARDIAHDLLARGEPVPGEGFRTPWE